MTSNTFHDGALAMFQKQWTVLSQDEYISAANAAAGSSEAESKKTLAARARSLAVSNPTRSKDATRGPWHRY